MKNLAHAIAEKSLTAVLVSLVLAVLGFAGTYLLGLWDGLRQPWTVASTIDSRFDTFEKNTAASVKGAVDPLKDDIATLAGEVQFLVANTPAIKVVDWDETQYKQIGSCTLESCIVSVHGARTDYGDGCGKVMDAGGQISIDGEAPVALSYDPSFEPIRLTKIGRPFRIPLRLNMTVTPGEHEWRSWAEYEGCKGPGEPKRRWSPWYPLIVE